MLSGTRKCLDIMSLKSGSDIVVRECSGSLTQQWHIEHYSEAV